MQDVSLQKGGSQKEGKGMSKKTGMKYLIIQGRKAKAKKELAKAEQAQHAAVQMQDLLARCQTYTARLADLTPEEVEAFYEDYTALEALNNKWHAMDLKPSSEVFAGD
jgi:hypothetical protein